MIARSLSPGRASVVRDAFPGREYGRERSQAVSSARTSSTVRGAMAGSREWPATWRRRCCVTTLTQRPGRERTQSRVIVQDRFLGESGAALMRGATPGTLCGSDQADEETVRPGRA